MHQTFINQPKPSGSKGGLISEVILTLVLLPTKAAKSFSLAKKRNFPPKALSKFLLVLLLVMEHSKVKTPSEIKPPLVNPIFEQKGIPKI